jgi:ABC-type multidrug transport system ATPase subunit
LRTSQFFRGSSQTIDVEFRDLGVCISPGFRKEKVTILSGASGRIAAGRILAIVGPSGAGVP